MPSRAGLGMRVMSHASWFLRHQQAGCCFFSEVRKEESGKKRKQHCTIYPHITAPVPFEGLVQRALKWKKMFSYYLIQSEREAGASRAAHWAPLWQSRLCCVYPPLSHTLIRLSFSLIENPPQWHSIRAAEWKPGYFYIFFPPDSAGARAKELITAL